MNVIIKRIIQWKTARAVGSIFVLCMAVLFLHWVAATSAVAHEANHGLKDESIKSAVESELLSDEIVPYHLLDIGVKEGICTLSGSVDNLLAKERAVKIARTITGVRSVINEISVKPVKRTDEKIRQEVAKALLDDPATDYYETKVKVKDGVVTVTGTVESWQERQLCTEVAKGVKGVKDIKNDMAIDYKASRLDHEIEADVKRRLKSDVWVDDALIQVAVKDGKVTLSGTVGSAAEKFDAYGDAWVAGVDAVDNTGLKVEWWARDQMRRVGEYATDEEIKKAVEQAFLYDPRVLSFNPNVNVRAGVITLTGVVEDLKAKQAAEQDAKNTVGVWRVKNYLKVRPKIQSSDDEIASRVRTAILFDPIIDRNKIDVSVHNGNVYLYGSVDSPYEKSHVQEVAARVKGVIGITNRLEMAKPWMWKTDWEIAQDIREGLRWNPYVDNDKITVVVDDGAAELTGTVDTWRERQEATEEAYEGGAKSVDNNLQVKFGPEELQPKS